MSQVLAGPLFDYAASCADRSAARVCWAANCSERRHYSSGLCPKHHQRWLRLGTTELPARRTLKDRFLSYVMPEPFSGCWLWTGAVDDSGYGLLNVNGLVQRAHRVSYSLFKGEIAGPHVFVCHQCDTECCANPNHLFLGTAKDNSQDCVRKDRNCRGERCGTHVLTDEQVKEIRTAYQPHACTYKMLGTQFGVDHTAIYKIVKNKRWKHLAC